MDLQAFADVLGGRVEQGAVRVDRPDGAVAVLGPRGGWLYRNAAAHDRWHRGGDATGLDLALEWGQDPYHWVWIDAVANLVGADLHHTGGGCWVVLFDRADGKLALFSDEGGMVFDSRASYEAKHEAGEDEVGDDGRWYQFIN